jgi:hypothetical protein
MTGEEFDAALVSAAFALGADMGWRKVSAAAAAQRAGLDLTTARERFPHRGMVLAKFGKFADIHALTGALTEGPVRERLFDILLRRFDFLQLHRAGVLALLKTIPLEPAWGVYLARANLESMGWMLEAAGVSARGIEGELRKQGLLAVWAWGMRAWFRDDSADLTTTMAAVDTALARADQIASRFTRQPAAAETDLSEPFIDPEIVSQVEPAPPLTPAPDGFEDALPDMD